MSRRPFVRWFGSALCVSGLWLAAGGASPAAAAILYGVSGTSLLRFDMDAHTASVVAAMQSGGSGLTTMEDCDFDGTGQLWAVREGNLGGFPPTHVSRAYQVDILTGNATAQGDFGSNASLQSLAFGGAAPAFYGVNSSGGTTSGHLVTADLFAGTVVSVGGAPHGLPGQLRVDALAFAPGGALYGVWNANPGGPFGSNDYKLVSFNLGSGAGTVIGSIGTSANAFLSLRFDSAGVAYTVDSNGGDVYTVSLATGQGTFLFAGGAAAVGTRGLAFIPAPGSAALLGLAMLAATRRRR